LTTRTSLLDGANTLSSRMVADSPTTGMMITITCVTVFQGSHLSLKKTSQTKKP
jgi:hypothetical protein